MAFNIKQNADGSTSLINEASGVEVFKLLADGTIDMRGASSVDAAIPNLIAAGGTLTITQALHHGKTILWDTAAGSILTLPAATGTGMKIRCVVSVLATSNDHSVLCVGSDMMQGAVGIIDTDTSDATIQFAALVGDTFDAITMNRTTTGLAAPGDWVELEDIISGIWAVRGLIRASGSVATPFTSG